MKLGRILVVAALLLMVLAPSAHLALADCSGDTSAPSDVPCLPGIANTNETSIYSILAQVIRILFYVLMFFAIIMILVAAFGYLTAQGDSEKVEKARTAILYAVIAIAIAVLARSIPFIVSQFVESNTGIPTSATRSDPGIGSPYTPANNIGDTSGNAYPVDNNQLPINNRLDISGNAATPGAGTTCSDTNPSGSCPSGKTCANPFATGWSCIDDRLLPAQGTTYTCSDTNPSGSCPTGKTCKPSGNTWACL